MRYVVLDAILGMCHSSILTDAQGEMLPLQGGTNEMIAHAVYKQLSEEEKAYMHFCWYTAKDMTRPINAKFKQRSCHSTSIKYILSPSNATRN